MEEGRENCPRTLIPSQESKRGGLGGRGGRQRKTRGGGGPAGVGAGGKRGSSEYFPRWAMGWVKGGVLAVKGGGQRRVGGWVLGVHRFRGLGGRWANVLGERGEEWARGRGGNSRASKLEARGEGLAGHDR